MVEPIMTDIQPISCN